MGVGCVQPSPPPARPTIEPEWPAAWRIEAQGVLAEAGSIVSLWNQYADFRLGTAQPPTPTQWLEGTQRANDLLARATRFHETIANSPIASDTWRQRRDLAAESQRLVELCTAIVAYRTEADRLAPGGDGTRALGYLETARALLDRAKADWA